MTYSCRAVQDTGIVGGGWGGGGHQNSFPHELFQIVLGERMAGRTGSTIGHWGPAGIREAGGYHNEKVIIIF